MMDMFFTSWMSLLRILIVGVAGYLGLIAILRISGNRTLSKMNSFDFIITIALGSTFASAILQKSVSLADAILAFSVLVGLQYAITWLAVRYPVVDKIVKAEPNLLFANGRFLRDAMKDSHVSEGEVLAGIRKQGFSTLDQVQFVVIETNGEVVAVGKRTSSTETPEGALTI